jgi:hypothetical protein
MAPRGQGAISPFDAELARAGRPQGGVVDKISTENRLASQGAALDDVGAASSILGSLLGSVRSATPEALMRVHDLDGILYFYQV